jgi:predicted 3-demethylubiquinone-9 3-methyltransferase (glyoxalase superfamily)
MPRITPFLWFDSEAEEAARFYTSIFPSSKIGEIVRRGGDVLTIEFQLDGKRFVALNGGPSHSFTDAVSFVVDCKDQDEVDRYWSALGEGGEEGPCGWLKDRYGLSWQIVPGRLLELLSDADSGRAERAMQAMLRMKKIEIGELERAAATTN